MRSIGVLDFRSDDGLVFGFAAQYSVEPREDVRAKVGGYLVRGGEYWQMRTDQGWQ